MVLRRAARFVKSTDSVTAMLDDLGWPILSKRRKDARLILFYKIMNNLAQVPHEHILTKAYERTRKKNNHKFRHILPNSLTSQRWWRSCRGGIIDNIKLGLYTPHVWRESKLTVHRLIFKEHCLKLKVAITKAKSHHYQQGISDCSGDQSKLFKCVNSLLSTQSNVHFLLMTVLYLYLLILMIILLRKFLFYNQLYLIMCVPNLAQRVSQRTVNF